MKGRELFLLAERGQRWGESTGKAHHPQKQLERKIKSGKAIRDLIRKGEGRKEKGEGLNAIKTL